LTFPASSETKFSAPNAVKLVGNDEALLFVQTVHSAALCPMLAMIHVFLDNARYHHAKRVQEWLARPDCPAFHSDLLPESHEHIWPHAQKRHS